MYKTYSLSVGGRTNDDWELMPTVNGGIGAASVSRTAAGAEPSLYRREIVCPICVVRIRSASCWVGRGLWVRAQKRSFGRCQGSNEFIC